MYNEEELTLIHMLMSRKKAMGPDLIPDAIFSGNKADEKRDNIIRDFLVNPVNKSHCRSRLVLLNKSKDPIPDIGDLRPISIMGTMQKLVEIKIVHYLKDAMKKTSPFQFGFKQGTGAGEAILRLKIKIKELNRESKPSGILFIDFKKAFDSVNRAKLYVKMVNFGIPKEIIKVIESIHDCSRTELGAHITRSRVEYHKDPLYPPSYSIYILMICLQSFRAINHSP